MKKHSHIFLKRKSTLILIFVMNISASLIGISSTYFNGIFLDSIIGANQISDIYGVLVIFFAIIIVGLLFRFLYSLLIPQVTERFIYDFKIKILSFKKEYTENNVSYLSKRIDEDTRQVTKFFIENFSIFLINFIEIIIVSILVFSINWHIGVLMVIVCPIYFGLYTIFKKPLFNRSLQFREKSAKFFGDYANEIEKEIFEEDTIKTSFLSYLKKYRDYIIINVGLSSSQGLIIGLVQVVVFFIGGVAVINGYTTIGLLSIVMMYFNQVIGNISYYLDLGRKWQITKASIKRIDELIE